VEAPASAQARLRTLVAADRRRIADGTRPLYHALWAPSVDGSVDITILELPLIHLFVPDEAGVIDGARLIIARALGVDQDAFDVVAGRPPNGA
jgi:hypothetical protein